MVDHRFSAAVMWQNTMGGTDFVRAFIYEQDYRDGLKSWFAGERPDGLVVGTESEAQGIAQELGLLESDTIRIAVTERPGPAFFSGIDQRSAEIGAASVAQLHGMIQRGEKGVPVVPGVMMIKGHWVQAPRRRGNADTAMGR